MNIMLGKTAGTCFGVENAINKATEELKKNNKLYCLGELVHNAQVTEELEKQGMIFISNVEQATGKVIIRAHGEPKETYIKAEKLGIQIIDLTCPKVLKIHKIVSTYTNNNYYIFITGKANHPEVIGIVGFCNKNYSVIESSENIEQSIQDFKKSNLKKALLISQTTFSVEKFNKIKEELNKNFQKMELEVTNTICAATRLRQEETAEIAKKVEAMIIIGGKHSSNTNKLYEIANKYCRNIFFTETEKEIDVEKLKKYKTIGVMAGASTPEKSIKKVIDILEKI